MIKQRLKVVAVAGVVVLALTGFSHHGGHGHSSGSGGGGCSGPSHTSGSGTGGTGGSYGSDSDTGSDTSSDTGSSYGSGDSYDDGGDLPASTSGARYGYNNRPTHRPTGTSSDGDAPNATATVKTLSCASPAAGGRKAVTSSKVQVSASNVNGGTAHFDVDVVFSDSGSSTVDTGTARVSLKPGQTKTVTVPMNAPSQVARVARCEASVL